MLSEESGEIENSDKDIATQYKELDEIIVSRRIEKDKGSKYFINNKEVRARDAQTFFADLSTGAHSPSMISQGKIGALVTSKPIERRSILLISSTKNIACGFPMLTATGSLRRFPFIS